MNNKEAKSPPSSPDEPNDEPNDESNNEDLLFLINIIISHIELCYDCELCHSLYETVRKIKNKIVT